MDPKLTSNLSITQLYTVRDLFFPPPSISSGHFPTLLTRSTSGSLGPAISGEKYIETYMIRAKESLLRDLLSPEGCWPCDRLEL